MNFSRKIKKTCSYISYIFWKRANNLKSQQVFYFLKLTELNANHFHSSYCLTIKQKHELRLNGHPYTRHYGFWDFSFFYLCGMTGHGNSFLKSIISACELHSFLRYLILKLEKSRQPVTKYKATTFCESFPFPPLRSMSLQITPRLFCGQITDLQH